MYLDTSEQQVIRTSWLWKKGTDASSFKHLNYIPLLLLVVSVEPSVMSINPNLPPSALARRVSSELGFEKSWNSSQPSSSSSSSYRPDSVYNPPDSYRNHHENGRKRPRYPDDVYPDYPEHERSRSFHDPRQYPSEHFHGHPSRDRASMQNGWSSTAPYRPSGMRGHDDRMYTEGYRTEHGWNGSDMSSRQYDRFDQPPSSWHLDSRNDSYQVPYSAAPPYPAYTDRQMTSSQRLKQPPPNLPVRPCWPPAQMVADVNTTIAASSSPASPRSHPHSHSRPPHTKKRRAVPLPEYFESAKKDPVRLDVPSVEKKFVLLDLNGTLVFRPKASAERTFRRRPFVGTFLDYLRARWEVGVWSSAQPLSVTKMIDFLKLQGGKDPHQLKLVWARDTFGLTPAEFNQKTETVKDLEVVYKHLNQESQSDGSPVRYSDENTLLIDDSHQKTGCQPFNHIPVPDYDGRLSTQSARAFKHASAAARSKKKGKKDKKAETKKPSGDGEEEVQEDDLAVDRTLLAVVGILERARGEESIVAWLRSGGLVPDLTDPNGWWIRSGSPDSGEKDVSAEEEDKDSLNLVYPVPRCKPIVTIPRSDLLPSGKLATPNIPWFESPDHLDFWTRRGVETLRSMGIDVVHGMDLSFIPRTDEEIAAAKSKKLAKAERQADDSARASPETEEV